MNVTTIKNRIKHLLYPGVSTNKDFVPYKKRFNILGTEFDFWIIDQTGEQWYDHNFWNNAVEFQLLDKMIKSNSNIIEFGLHHGFSATYMSKKIGNEGKYVGVELLPIASLYSMANLKLNDISSNCRIINAAGGDKAGMISFANQQNANGHVVTDRGGVQIMQITGDSLLADVGNKVDCLKIDVEGFEVKVLEGCKNILAQLPNIDLEIHVDSIKSYGNDMSRIFELIDLDKYFAYFFWNSGTQYIDPTSHKLSLFTRETIPEKGIINLFLFSKNRIDSELLPECI